MVGVHVIEDTEKPRGRSAPLLGRIELRNFTAPYLGRLQAGTEGDRGRVPQSLGRSRSDQP